MIRQDAKLPAGCTRLVSSLCLHLKSAAINLCIYSTLPKVLDRHAFFFSTRVFGLLFQPTIMNQRKALAPIEINRSYGQELSPFQRGQISAYKAVGLSNSKIGEKLACSKSTVFNTFVRNPLRNEGKSLPCTGRSSALNCVQKRNILCIICTNSKIIYAALKLEADVSVHQDIIY